MPIPHKRKGRSMTQTIGKALKWLLCGGAFVAVVASAGCGGHRSAVTTEPPRPLVDPYREAAPSIDRLFDNTQTETAEAKPPVINIFGEVNGQAPAPMKQLGEAGFQQ